MTHIALYRKYRPKTFDDVAGQDHIVTTLQSAITNNRISHAYLFSGSRGIGKTSIARIFAAEIGTAPEDIYEIDAASNRGIDDIRALRDAVHTMPMRSTYKVYIIDEVHMLTKEAFNALLKTLEEPPAHVVFILATTEMHKLPDTVVSRCQVFEFKKPNAELLSATVKKVAQAEGFSIDDMTADLIGTLGDGAFRDTLGVLGQVLDASPDKDITYEYASGILGTPAIDSIFALITAMLKGDAPSGLAVVAGLKEKGTDISLCMQMMLTQLRLILLVRFGGITIADIRKQYSSTTADSIESLAGDSSLAIGSATLLSVIEAIELSKHSPIAGLPLELLIIDCAKTA